MNEAQAQKSKRPPILSRQGIHQKLSNNAVHDTKRLKRSTFHNISYFYYWKESNSPGTNFRDIVLVPKKKKIVHDKRIQLLGPVVDTS